MKKKMWYILYRLFSRSTQGAINLAAWLLRIEKWTIVHLEKNMRARQAKLVDQQ